MKLKDLREQRRRRQLLTWPGLAVVAVGGWYWPWLGYLLLGCMAGAVGLAFFRGRAWCDWMCPRGAFFDLFVGRYGRRARIPGFLRSPWMRGFMVALIMTVLGTQVWLFRGDWARVGLAFVMLLTVTTAAGVVMGLVWRERAWCLICPMGTLAALVSGGKEPLSLKAAACTDCGACARVCPMQLEPASGRPDGVVRENDCVKCRSCAAACPSRALSFREG
jgi:ferredoxin-type protein NapH